jgi:hypothetical protein
MTTDDFVSELYRDLEWRTDELIQLKNLLTHEPDPTARDLLRKSLVMVLYAHFEGFCVFSLEHYQRAINEAGLECREVIPAILAGSWEKVFNAMEHGDEKCKVFRHSLPDDPHLHRHWRRRHFIEETERFLSLRVSIPEHVIDTESNLKPAILQRNLFLLGLDHTFVEPHADTINGLLGRRNRIAHGDDRRGVPEREYNGYESTAYEICFKFIDLMQDAHQNERYRKQPPSYMI